MRTALIILAVVAVVLVLIGAFNADAEVTVDLVAGSVHVSLFWLAAGVAAAIALAGIAGWTLGRVAGMGRRRKLESELEATYRRLREAEARQPQLPAAERPAETPAAVSLQAVTVEQPPEAVTVEQPPEDVTVEQPTGDVTVEQPPEAVTVEQPPEDETVEQPVTVGQPTEAVTVEQPTEDVTAEQPDKDTAPGS